jgi:hypothetical protein
MNSINPYSSSPLSITKTDLHLLESNIQDQLKNIEEIATRCNQKFESKKNLKWCKYSGRRVLFACDLDMKRLKNWVVLNM